MLYHADTDTINNTRNALIDAIAARRAGEVSGKWRNVNLESKLRFLDSFKQRVERADAFTIAYLANHPRDYELAFNSQLRSNAAMNIYALPKCLEVSRILNGGALSPQMGGDNATLAGTILGIAAGIRDNKRLAAFLEDIAPQWGRKYTPLTAKSQAGSSCRALEAMGVIDRGNNPIDQERWQRCVDAAHGKHASIEAAHADASALEESGGSVTARERRASRARKRAGKRAGKRAQETPIVAASPAPDAPEAQETGETPIVDASPVPDAPEAQETVF